MASVMIREKPLVVHRWVPRGTTPCGLRIDQKPLIATNVGQTFNRGVTCPGCLLPPNPPRQKPTAR